MRLLEESFVITCPNPKCRRQFKESIVLTINSVEPPKQYEACPFCFASLEIESPNNKENTSEQEPQKVVVQEPILENETLKFEEFEENLDELTDEDQEKKDSGSGFFSKVKSLIPGSSGTKKDKKQKTEESETDLGILVEKEDRLKDKIEIKTPSKTEEQKNIESANKQDANSGCPQSFGYLANRPKDEPIPQVCFVCPKMVDCMLSPKEN
ncbi:MAG: hypothetical protein P8Y18_00980 [Candidatus Bathyarchaeota archaeon]